MHALVAAFQTDRHAAVIHACLGLFFPLFVVCALLLIGIAMNSLEVTRYFSGVLIVALFYPMNKLAERLSGPWPERFGLLTRVVPMFVCLAVSAAVVFLFLIKE